MMRILVHPFTRMLTLVMILGLITLAALDTTGVKARMSNLVFETYMKVKPRPASDKLMFVDIDDLSLSNVGQWPWPRTKIAQLVTNINQSGASVIVFDGVIAEPDRTSPDNIARLLGEGHPAIDALTTLKGNDEILADAIATAENFVTGFSHGSNATPPKIKQDIKAKREIREFFLDQKEYKSGYFQTTAQFLPNLQKAAAGNGSFMASPENDAVIRRTGVIFHNDKTIYPSLFLEGIRLHQRQSKPFITLKANEGYSNIQIKEPFRVEIGDYSVPIDAEGKMWVYFRKYAADEKISAYKFLDEHYDRKSTDLTGKIVFIASSAEGLMDLRATPFGYQPGVRVHMNATEQILENQYLVRPFTADLLEIGAAAGVSLLIIALSFFFNPFWLLLMTIGVSGGAFWLSWYLFEHYGGLFDPVTPGFMVALVFVASSVLSYLKTEYERRQVRGAFGMYVSRDVMRDLEKNPHKLKLGGENKPLTVMFTDIRSFTTISEGLTPEELIQLMNDFLTAMSDIVMEYEGTIDKYMGDAMMAFWNAPKDVEDHEHKACLAALKMQEALEPINHRLREKAKQEGKEPVLLQAGIGLNTGLCAVGNMGSKQRFAYSTLGDAVNLASRLEGQTKTYGVQTLIGEETCRKVPDLATLQLDLIQVKGKTLPVRVYALLGDQDTAKSAAFNALKTGHDEMVEAYQAGDFESAQKALKACRKLDLYGLYTAYDLYEARIKKLIKNPPGDNWTGVYEAKSK